jgi:hypothetical protein
MAIVPVAPVCPVQRVLRIDTQDERTNGVPMGLFRLTAEATVSRPGGEDAWRFGAGDFIECSEATRDFILTQWPGSIIPCGEV